MSPSFSQTTAPTGFDTYCHTLSLPDALPILRGRTPRGFRQPEPVGVAIGIESVALTSSQVPSHTHAFAGTAAAANARSAQDSLYAASSANLYAQPDAQVTLAGSTVQDSGSSSPHDNMQPYRTLNFCVALAGVLDRKSTRLNSSH